MRLILFLIVTPWEIGVILTANYAFLNYLVLSLGLLLLDDNTLRRFVPARFSPPAPSMYAVVGPYARPGPEESERGSGILPHLSAIRVGDVMSRQVNFETIHAHEVVAERYGTIGELRGELARGGHGPLRHTELRDWLRG